jgi:hypothetical protein
MFCQHKNWFHFLSSGNIGFGAIAEGGEKGRNQKKKSTSAGPHASPLQPWPGLPVAQHAAMWVACGREPAWQQPNRVLYGRPVPSNSVVIVGDKSDFFQRKKRQVPAQPPSRGTHEGRERS